MVRKIAVVTATRAEYGLLAPVVKQLRTYEDSGFKAELVVTGTHLSEQYGRTIREIEDDGVRIDGVIEIPMASESALDISKNQADILVKFTSVFLQKQYDAIILLGDRYEMLAVAIAAGNARIPIFHLCGGDTTEGAIDEWIRHSITKMSYLHFVTNRESYDRVLQLGEAPDRVFDYGSTSIDNIRNMGLMPKQEVLGEIGLPECRYALCTYHPVTLGNAGIEVQMQNFFKSAESFPNLEFIVTKSNADQGGARINELLDWAGEHVGNMHVFNSLGVRRYLSLMRHAELVLGNSSSGIIEAPALRVPTVNIGDRQKGRLQPASVINCRPDADSIFAAIHTALSGEFHDICKKVGNPYGDGHAAERIAKKAVETVVGGGIDLKKKFWSGDGQDEEYRGYPGKKRIERIEGQEHKGAAGHPAFGV